MLRLILITLVALPACSWRNSEPCKPQASRCAADGSKVEMCGPSDRWFTVMKCKDMGPTWTCKVVAGDPACVEAK